MRRGNIARLGVCLVGRSLDAVLGRILSVFLVVAMVGSAFPTLMLIADVEAAEPVALTDNAVLKFDFGTRVSPVMPGWTQVQGGLLYSRGAGYGWDVAHADFHNLRRPPEINPYVIQRSWVIDRYTDEVTVDGVRDEDPMTFSADLPNGDYRVRATLGDLFYPLYSMNITAEGQQVAGELAAFHLVHRSVYMKDASGNWANYGMPLPYWFSVTVSDGILDLTFDGTDDLFWDRMDIENVTSPPNSYLTAMSTGGVKPGGVNPPYRYIGGPHTYNSVLGIEIYPARQDLIISMGPKAIVLDGTVTNPSVIAAVASYNSASSQTEYEDVATTVQELLMDHETGDLTDYKALEELMAHLQGNLDADLEPTHLQDRIDGLQTLLARDPSDQTLWELLNQTERLRMALDFIFERVETGKNHFYENSKAATILWSFQPGDALYHNAEMWRARALYMLDPHRWISSSGTGADVMDGLRAVDPDNPYITMYRDTVPGGGRIWKEGQRIISTTGKVDHWTKAEVTEGWEGAPLWARWLREELYWLYDITDWWVLNRQQPDGALGGGWSDDVEFIGLFGFDALISQGADDLSLVGARKFVDGMLDSGGVDMERGYSVALADAEHTAEWTGDSLPMMIAVDYGNPKWVEFSYKTGVLMRDLWMDETDKGHLHFRSNYLSATKIGGTNTQEDAYINYRAALPAHWVGWYNGDPEIEKLFIDWATAWVEDAMRTDYGKPMGVFPASIGFADDELGGHNSPNWFTAHHQPGTVNYDWQPQKYRGYLEDLVRGAYEATGNESLLEPFKLEAELAEAYLDDPVPSPTPSSAAWAGMILGSKAISLWDSIRIDYNIQGGGGMSGEPNGYTPEAVIGMTLNGRRYIDHCLPLMTTEASATDRVAFVGIINPFMIYTGGGVGGALLAPKVTYTGLERDFAACVLDARPSGVQVLMYGFHHGTKDAGLVLWELKNGGTYKVTVGDDNDGDGVVDVVDYTNSFEYLTKGQEVPIQLIGAAEKLVVVEKVENGTDVRALLPDLALTSEDISENTTTGKLDIIVHNIGANTSGPFKIIVEDADLADNELCKVTSGPLEPPSGLLPSTRSFSLRLARAPSFGNVTVYIEQVNGFEFTEITTLNNRAWARLNLSLLEFNERPVYIGPDPPEPLVLEEDEDLIEPVPIADVADLFEDDGGFENLEFVVEATPYPQTNVTTQFVNGTLSVVSLKENWNGNVSYTFTAVDLFDPGIETYSPPFQVIVTPVNDPPEYIGPPEGEVLYVDEDEIFNLHDRRRYIELHDLTTLFTNVDGDQLNLYFKLLEGADYVEFWLRDGILRLTDLSPNWHGNVTYTVTAWDHGDNLSSTLDDQNVTSPVFTIVVRPVNDRPYQTSQLEDLRLEEGLDLTLDFDGTFYDVDEDTLFYRISSDPMGYIDVEFDPSDPDGTTIIITFAGEWTGTLDINVTVTAYDRDPDGSDDELLSSSTTFVVTAVRSPKLPNQPPSAPTISFEPDQGVVGTLVSIDASGSVDPEGGVVRYRFIGDGLMLRDWNVSQAFDHTFAEAGIHNITCLVSDILGAQNSTWTYYEVVNEPSEPDPDTGEPVTWWPYALMIIIVAAVAAILLYVVLRKNL